MQTGVSNKLPTPSFWLSVLVHLLLLASCLVVITFQQEEKTKTPNLYVPAYIPSYTYTGSVAAPTQPSSSPRKQTAATTHSTTPRKSLADLSASPDKAQASAAATSHISLDSILSSTQTVLKQNQRDTLNSTKNSEPIYLIGDMDGIADPLIKLLGTALSANFSYPKMEGELGIKGRVLVGLTLHPEGYISDIQILGSSNNHDFDSAALYAVNQAPAIPGADRFLSEPKHFVIGFIFR